MQARSLFVAAILVAGCGIESPSTAWTAEGSLYGGNPQPLIEEERSNTDTGERAVRLYMVPLEERKNEFGITTHRGPKYFVWRFAQAAVVPPTVQWSLAADYGAQSVALVAADVVEAEHDLLSAQPDVIAFSKRLDRDLEGTEHRLRVELESFRVPAEWVTSSSTTRQALRGIAGVFGVSGRFSGLGYGSGSIFQDGVSLDTTISALPLGYRETLFQAVDELGFDRSGVNDSNTVRELLSLVALQARSRGFTELGLVI